MIPNYFNVIPCNGKVPLIKWQQFVDRFPTAEEKAQWPSSKDYGFLCGPVSKIFVLDVDGPEGEKSLEGRFIPRTATVKTPHGRHYYFWWVAALDGKITTKTDILGSKESDKTCGLDVRGHGGFIAFYGWERSPAVAPMSPPPQWLIDLLPNKDISVESGKRPAEEAGHGGTNNAPLPNSSTPISKFQELLDGVKPGNRNETFFKLASSLRARNYKPQEIFDLLVSKAREVGFSEAELLRTCQSAGRYEPKGDFKSADLEGSNSLSDFLADAKETPYIVPGFIAENTINVFCGLAESRKSWILLDLAIAIASGGEWLTKYPCFQRSVMLIDQERPKMEMQRRIKALLDGRGMTMAALEGRLVPKVGTTIRINTEQSYEKLCRMLEDVKPEVVLIDSLKAFQSGAITDNQEMQLVFERFKELRLKYGITFVILHHENKGGYQRTREKMEVTAENVAGAASIIEVPEGIFVAVNHDPLTSMMHHVKNSYGLKKSPFLIRVVDLNEEKTSIRVEAY